MRWLLVPLLAIFSLAGWSQSAPEEDLIKNLPGVPGPLPFKQYSGYLEAKSPRLFHYWFVESANNPRTDPVLLWLTGGPGCSSMSALLTENGPFWINEDGRTLSMNVHGWNQVANVIFLESPAGVGFSYATDKNYTTNDDETAANNLLALRDFFTKFPEYMENDFYITGESYGGIYVPTLASDVIDDGTINLKGFAVGNGLSDRDMDGNSQLFYYNYHGFIGSGLWENIVSACCPNNISDGCDFHKAISKPKCHHAIRKLSLQGINIYNILHDCINSDKHPAGTRLMVLYQSMASYFTDLRTSETSVGGLVYCINSTAPTTYLQLPEVRKALHIPDYVKEWEICNGLDYNQQYNTVRPFYEKALKKKLKILVYNGDMDTMCNFLGDEWFVDSLKPQNLHKTGLWFYKNQDGSKQVGGFAKQFDHITFVTVKEYPIVKPFFFDKPLFLGTRRVTATGAGHMSPGDKPLPVLTMLTNFLQDQPF